MGQVIKSLVMNIIKNHIWKIVNSLEIDLSLLKREDLHELVMSLQHCICSHVLILFDVRCFVNSYTGSA